MKAIVEKPTEIPITLTMSRKSWDQITVALINRGRKTRAQRDILFELGQVIITAGVDGGVFPVEVVQTSNPKRAPRPSKKERPSNPQTMPEQQRPIEAPGGFALEASANIGPAALIPPAATGAVVGC